MHINDGWLSSQLGINYCNSCLWGVSSQQLKHLQLVQNTATRIVTRTQKREHITPVLKELHWLLARKRIDHKIVLLAYKCYEGTALELSLIHI